MTTVKKTKIIDGEWNLKAESKNTVTASAGTLCGGWKVWISTINGQQVEDVAEWFETLRECTEFVSDFAEHGIHSKEFGWHC